MAITALGLKRKIKKELKDLSFSFDKNGGIFSPTEKDSIKLLHKPSREIELKKGEEWINRFFPRYQNYFANGSDINPAIIKPLLVRVTEEWHKNLFRLARYYWSIPYSL